jgi:hypothetical protein
MRKAPRGCRGAETERIKSDQAVHALGWEPVPVPIVVVMVDVHIRARSFPPALTPMTEETWSAVKHMINKFP